MNQLSFLDPRPRKQGRFVVFHDESEPVANKGWLLIGLLFVHQDHEKAIRQQLNAHRQAEQYTGEIHFCQLPNPQRIGLVLPDFVASIG